MKSTKPKRKALAAFALGFFAYILSFAALYNLLMAFDIQDKIASARQLIEVRNSTGRSMTWASPKSILQPYNAPHTSLQFAAQPRPD